MEYKEGLEVLAFFEALDAWTAVVGPENIVRAEDELSLFNNNTFSVSSELLAVVYPKTTEEVSQCMKIANHYKIEVYAISRGQNYGLGSKLPPEGKCILLELSKMNKIVELNEELAYVVLEPGVSFAQLHRFLEEQKSNLMMDSIGSTKNASIVGNLAERGHGMALYADRMNFVCNFEVVLPTGEILNTSFENEAGHTHKWGIGPLLNGLFTQSNLGIITKLTLWLHPKSTLFESFVFYIKDNEMLGKAMACIRDLKLQGVQMSLRIFNDLRMISFYQNYPWEMMKGKTPLSEEVKHFLRAKYNIEGKWVGLGAIYPFSKLHGEAERAYIKEKLTPYVSDLEFINEDSILTAKLRKDKQELSRLDVLYSKSLLRGFVSEQALNMCYWRKKEVPLQKNIHRDNCGVLWFCPVVPTTTKDIQQATKIIEEICENYALETNLGFLCIGERSLDLTGAICFDKLSKEESKQAIECHNTLLDKLSAAGYPAYRLGIQSMKMMEEYCSEEKLKVLKELKKLFDPNSVLSKGRYI